MHPRVRDCGFAIAAFWLAGAILQPGSRAFAEVHFDNSVGRVKVTDNRDGFTDIPFSAGSKVGGNLFHSFSSFRVNSNAPVTFKNAQPGDFQAGNTAPVSNIIGRVTGPDASQINGQLISEIPNANVYLLNPHGVMFGNGASLSISGSFFASTATQLKFGAQASFDSAGKTEPATALTLPPTGFGFTGKSGAIVVQNTNLHGANGTTLGLIGGRVQVETSQLDADGGEVLLASVSKGALSATTAGRTSSSFTAGTRGGAVTLSGSIIGNEGSAAAGTGLGRMVIRSGTLALDHGNANVSAVQAGDGIYLALQSNLSARSSNLVSLVFGDFRGRSTFSLSGRSAALREGSSFATGTLLTGQGGDLRLELSGRLTVRDGSVTLFNAAGRADGNLTVRAGSALLDHQGVILGQNLGTQQAGRFQVSVQDDLTIQNGGAISLSSARGALRVDAGRLSLQGRDENGTPSRLEFNDDTPGASLGLLAVNVRDKLTILDGAQIEAIGAARAGRRIDIAAGDAVLSGRGVGNTVATGIVGDSNGPAGSRGGAIHLQVKNELQVLDGAAISSNTFGFGQGGAISIEAGRLTVTGRPGVPGSPTTPRGISAQNPAFTGGPSGDIDLRVGLLTVRDAGEINASTQGAGRGGNISVRGGTLEVSSGGRLTAETSGIAARGPGGDITLQLSDSLSVLEGGSITVSTIGRGAGGNLDIRASSMLIQGAGAEIAARSGSPTEASLGRGGNITVNAGGVAIADGGQLTASAYSLGQGGDVTLAADRLSIRQDGAGTATGIAAQTLGLGPSGRGGRLDLSANEVLLHGTGATVTTSSSGRGGAGAVQLHGREVRLESGSTIQSASAAAGVAGQVEVAARNLTLTGGSSITVAATRSSAGDLAVRASDSIRLTGSSITGQAALTGGSVTLQARDLLFLRDSRVTAAAQNNGGNINIDPQLVVLDHSLIDARAIFATGGNIQIRSTFFLPSPESLITATSARGIDGEVQIDALNIDLTGSLVELPSTLLNAESLLRELCTMKLDDFSSFVRQGRGGVPPAPGGWLPSLEIAR